MKVNILVVDDEPDSELLFKQNFQEEIDANTMELYYANSGEQALQTLSKIKEKINLIIILSDINMPGMRGIKLLQEIKKSYPTSIIFMITSYGKSEEVIRAWEYGAEEIIIKPINFNYLKNLIQDLIRASKITENGGHL